MAWKNDSLKYSQNPVHTEELVVNFALIICYPTCDRKKDGIRRATSLEPENESRLTSCLVC